MSTSEVISPYPKANSLNGLIMCFRWTFFTAILVQMAWGHLLLMQKNWEKAKIYHKVQTFKMGAKIRGASRSISNVWGCILQSSGARSFGGKTREGSTYDPIKSTYPNSFLLNLPFGGQCYNTFGRVLRKSNFRKVWKYFKNVGVLLDR